MSDPDRCPACPEDRALLIRHLEKVEATVRECTACGGVWVGSDVIKALGERARADLLPLWVGAPLIAPQGESADRFCLVCGAQMSRKACGNVVVDVCGTDGVWFDREELEHFVGWVRHRAEVHSTVLAKAQTGMVSGSFFALPPPPGDRFGPVGGGSFDGGEWLGESLGLLFEIFCEILGTLADF